MYSSSLSSRSLLEISEPALYAFSVLCGINWKLGVGGVAEDIRVNIMSNQESVRQPSPSVRTVPRTSWKAAFLAGQRPRKRPEDDLRRQCARSGQPHTSSQGEFLGNFNRSTLAQRAISRRSNSDSLLVKESRELMNF
jgi:hypothetical protein